MFTLFLSWDICCVMQNWFPSLISLLLLCFTSPFPPQSCYQIIWGGVGENKDMKHVIFFPSPPNIFSKAISWMWRHQGVGFAKYQLGEVGENKDMKHVNSGLFSSHIGSGTSNHSFLSPYVGSGTLKNSELSLSPYINFGTWENSEFSPLYRRSNLSSI